MESPFHVRGKSSASAPWAAEANGFWLFDDGGAYQMVPLAGARTVSVDGSPKRRMFSVARPSEGMGNLTIKTDANRSISGLFDSFIIEPQETSTEFEITGNRESINVFFLSGMGEQASSYLVLSVLPPVTRRFCVYVILNDMVNSLEYSQSALINMLHQVQKLYAIQTNIHLVREQNLHLLTAPTVNLGSPINVNARAGDMILDAVNKTSDPGRTIRLIYAWDFESDESLKTNRASGLTSPGRDYSFIDWNQQAVVTAHEIGHAFGLGDRPAGDPTLMMKTAPAGGNLLRFPSFDWRQIEALNRYYAHLGPSRPVGPV